MLKLLGSVLIFGACCSLGLAAQQGLRQRVHALDAMLSALDYMAGELQCRLTPLPVMIETLAAAKDHTTACVFSCLQAKLGEDNGQSLPYKWCQAFRQCREEAGLDEEETAVLCDMAAFLGRYDAAQQVKSLELVRKRLTEIRTSAQREARVRGNLYRTCGAAIGAMAVLILL